MQLWDWPSLAFPRPLWGCRAFPAISWFRHFRGAHYVVVSPLKRSADVDYIVIPKSFDACTVTFEVIEVLTWQRFSDEPTMTTKTVTRYALPLGAVISSDIAKRKMPDTYSRDSQTVSDIIRWRVRLDTKTRLIMRRTEQDGRFIEINSVATATLDFGEEELAKRILSAFKHAAGLCRTTEPF